MMRVVSNDWDRVLIVAKDVKKKGSEMLWDLLFVNLVVCSNINILVWF
jgi:hypothetical protein